MRRRDVGERLQDEAALGDAAPGAAVAMVHVETSTGILNPVREIAAVNELRLVQHVGLERLVSVMIEREALPDVLDVLLGDDSYQLYQAVETAGDSDNGQQIPSALWVFSEGTVVATAATGFLETVILQGENGEKKEAIRELGRLGTDEAVQALSIALADKDSQVRKAAMEALSNVGGDEALAAIASASTAEDLRVRADATYALAMAGGYSSIEYLRIRGAPDRFQ